MFAYVKLLIKRMWGIENMVSSIPSNRFYWKEVERIKKNMIMDAMTMRQKEMRYIFSAWST